MYILRKCIKYIEENTEKYKTFSIPIQEKEIIKINEGGNGSVVTISYKITFIETRKFMAKLLSNIVDFLTEVIQKIMRKDWDCFLECESVKDNSTKYKHLFCSEDYSK